MSTRRSGMQFAVAMTVLSGSAVAALPPSTNTPVTTVSASRQFIACANDRLLPSALCAHAERVKREWLRRLDAVDNWRDPILILVQSRQPQLAGAPAVSIAVFQTDTHLEYRIRCLVPPRIDKGELSAAIVDALCLERASRDQMPDPSQPYTAPQVPLWLVEGLASSFGQRDETVLPVAKRSVIGGQPRLARDVMETASIPEDLADRQLFQANAAILTGGLLRLDNGSGKLRRFLSELGRLRVASNAFWKVYHDDFPNATALEKWWSLELVARTSEMVAQDLSAENTRQDLDAILVTKLGPAGGRRGMPGDIDVAINDLWRYEGSPWMGNLLRIKIDRIGALRGVVHPLYLPVLDEYTQALVWLQGRNVTRFRRSLRRASAMRTQVDKQTRRITACLDEAERVYSAEPLANILGGYFQTFDQFQKLESDRHSPISDYLDRFDH